MKKEEINQEKNITIEEIRKMQDILRASSQIKSEDIQKDLPLPKILGVPKYFYQELE
jgi:hypothetical protein